MSFIPRQYIAGTTGMNMSVENNMLQLLCQTNLSNGQPMLFDFFAKCCMSLQTFSHFLSLGTWER